MSMKYEKQKSTHHILVRALNLRKVFGVGGEDLQCADSETEQMDTADWT